MRSLRAYTYLIQKSMDKRKQLAVKAIRKVIREEAAGNAAAEQLLLEQGLVGAAGQAAKAAGGGVINLLAQALFGKGKGTPQQIASLRDVIRRVRTNLAAITNAFVSSDYGLYKKLGSELRKLQKASEAAFAANNPRQVQAYLSQAATVSAYMSAFPNIAEDMEAIYNAHIEEIESPTVSAEQLNTIVNMISNNVLRELNATNYDKLGALGKSIKLLGIKWSPAPAGLKPQDIANAITKDLRDAIPTTSTGAPPASTTTPPAPVAEGLKRSIRLLSENAKRSRYQVAVGNAFCELLEKHSAINENAQETLQQFRDATKTVAQGVRNAAAKAQQPPAIATGAQPPSASGQMASPAAQGRAAKVKGLLGNVGNIIGSLTPEEKQALKADFDALKAKLG